MPGYYLQTLHWRLNTLHHGPRIHHTHWAPTAASTLATPDTGADILDINTEDIVVINTDIIHIDTEVTDISDIDIPDNNTEDNEISDLDISWHQNWENDISNIDIPDINTEATDIRKTDNPTLIYSERNLSDLLIWLSWCPESPSNDFKSLTFLWG